MKKPLPEVRNSHLAGRLERERALKGYARMKQQKQKDSATTPKPETNVVQMPAQPGQPMVQEPFKMKRCGKPLPSRDRDTVVVEIGRRGAEEVARDITDISPGHSRERALALLREIEKDPGHRFWDTIRRLVAALARKYRNELQFHAPNDRGSSAIQAPPAQPSVLPEGFSEVVKTMAQVAATMQQVAASMASPPARPALPSARSRDFADMRDEEIRTLLRVHHTRAGRDLSARGVHGGIDGGIHAAWSLSYDEYERQTKVNVRALAREASEQEGREIRPLDIIAELGELHAFWDVVRSMGAQ